MARDNYVPEYIEYTAEEMDALDGEVDHRPYEESIYYDPIGNALPDDDEE